MYDIKANITTTDGDRLHTVMLRHAPRDADKVVRLRESMACDGWQGRPVILANGGDCHHAFTGTHRLCAAMDLDIEIAAVMLPDDLTAEDWDEIDQAHDDDDLLAAFERIAADRDDMDEVVAALKAEIDSNRKA